MTFATFTELNEAVRARIDAGDRESALMLLGDPELALPLHAGLIYQWRAGLLAELGQTDSALDVLGEALAAGCRYKGAWLRDEPRMAALRGNSRFENIVERAASRYEHDQSESRGSLRLLTPATPAPSSGYPTLFVLHGNNSNVAETLPYWRSAPDAGWLTALPQSSEIGASPGAYTWNDRDRTLAELERHRRELSANSTMNETMVVLAGFSMGGLQAIALALTRRFDAQGVLAVGAYLPHIREFSTLIASGNAAGKRFHLVVGAKDASGYDGATRLAQELERAGVAVVLDDRPDLGHAYPANMDQTLRSALVFLQGPAAR